VSTATQPAMPGQAGTGSSRLVAYVSSYGSGPDAEGGGIAVFEVSADGRQLTALSRVDEPREAGYLAYAPAWSTLYAVDERKTDGRGPVEPPAGVHAFAADQQTGNLSPLNWRPAPGPRPTFLSVDQARRVVITANHGDFDHVEHVVQAADGRWTTEYLYDDSTVLMYDVEPDGRLGELRDVQVLTGHGTDPNGSAQAGGHGQASPHAHCAVIDPSGDYLLVGDKGTDQILVFRLGPRLELASAYRFPDQTGPRHIAFDPLSGHAFVTCEFSSELASMAFDASAGKLRVLDQQPTADAAYQGRNEPADVRVHPGGGLVYVNNRGEDSVAWFRAGPAGELSRLGHVRISQSVHPGLAARSFALDPTGSFLLVADRPANTLRSYAVDPGNGDLHHLADVTVADPAFVVFAELEARPGGGE
jgi:6-phosphogluconolactonase